LFNTNVEGVVFSEYPVFAAVAMDVEGHKHLLGLFGEETAAIGAVINVEEEVLKTRC